MIPPALCKITAVLLREAPQHPLGAWGTQRPITPHPHGMLMGLRSPPCLGFGLAAFKSVWPMCWRIGAAVMEQWARPAAHQLGRRCSGLHTIIALLMLARLLETCVSSSCLAKLLLISKLWPQILAPCGRSHSTQCSKRRGECRGGSSQSKCVPPGPR